MMKLSGRRAMAAVALAFTATLLGAKSAYAHCDGMDGPVVKAAQKALETGDVKHALVWVLAGDEQEIRHVFEHTRKVRVLGEDARTLADRFFFETLVRLHRAGEGEPYTGLKPAGRDLGPAIPAADRALETGSVAQLEQLLNSTMREGLHERFKAAAAARNFVPDDLKAGREYVHAYVLLLHYVEALHATAAGAGAHDAPAVKSPEPGHGH